MLDRPSQLDLDGVGHSEGIFAPTIRFHLGIFYVITTNISKGGNFIVTATNPAGPWSDPYWLPNAPGIDPSLFFDDDHRAYYVGTRPAPEGEKHFGNWEIWLQELDLKTLNLKGNLYPLWRGALKDVIWPEGPHIYKKDGWYYLMIAEGGTDYHHSVTIARSKSLNGPFEGNPGNPILTHRHLGRTYPIVNTGHGDLIDTQTGEWWMVLLGSRPYGGYYRNLGRETFLVPIQWEDDWPIASPGTGRVEFTYPVPNLPEVKTLTTPIRDDFKSDQLNLIWNFIRTPRESFWSLSERKGYLRVKLKPVKITEQVNPSFIGRRQQHQSFSAQTVMEFSPQNEFETAGIALVQSNEYHFRFEYGLKEKTKVIRLVQCVKGTETLLNEKEFTADQIYLKVTAFGQDYNFYYGINENPAQICLEKVAGRILSTDIAGGFVGTYIGMFGSSNGQDSQNYVEFDWFDYQGYPEK